MRLKKWRPAILTSNRERREGRGRRGGPLRRSGSTAVQAMTADATCWPGHRRQAGPRADADKVQRRFSGHRQGCQSTLDAVIGPGVAGCRPDLERRHPVKITDTYNGDFNGTGRSICI